MKCIICDREIKTDRDICDECAKIYILNTEEAKEVTDELRDIAAVLKITENTDSNIKNSMESLLRIADRMERRSNEATKRKAGIQAADR